MSRTSVAKKARRKKRQVARNDAWLPADVHADIKGVRRIADEIIPRGWEFDHEFSTDEFVTWYFPPSGVEVPDDLDEAVEPVTRIWLTDPLRPHVILVGSDQDADDVALTVEELFGRLEAIEEHRLGEPVPQFG
jgi:hypothetical protein